MRWSQMARLGSVSPTMVAISRGRSRAIVVTTTPPALITASQAAASHGPFGPRSRTRLPGCRPKSSVSTWASWLVRRTVSP